MRPNNKYRAAIYLRISRDDEDKAESNSIQNQRELLKSFIDKTSDIDFIREFSDDGYSGTNFDRPGFIRMMDMVQSKDINCIIVKDLSRLGRNYIDTGRYIEQIFPSLGVRFISVNDNYDSIKEINEADQIIIPFKNLINDAYCRDISMKIRSQLDVKRRNGKFVGAFAGYGYLKDPRDKYHLIIDDTAAEIVRTIFDMKMDGYSPGRIADHLNDMGVLTPQEYKRSIGLNSNSGYWKCEHPRWVAPTVIRILTNELYVGNISQGKYRKVNYKVNRLEVVDKRDWIKKTGTHEPIISRAVFDRVQYMLASDTRTSPGSDTVNIFAGVVKCAGCGQNMIRRVTKKGDKEYVYYMCSTAKAGGDCTYHSINAENLDKAVLKAVQTQMVLLLDPNCFTHTITEAPRKSHRVTILEEQLSALEKEIEKYRNLKERLYEDYVEGIVDADDYEELRKRFAGKINAATQTAGKLDMEIRAEKDKPVLPPEWLEEVRSIGMVKALTRKTVIMLIDRIVVYDKNRIEIVFHYSDEIAEAVKAARKKAREGEIAV